MRKSLILILSLLLTNLLNMPSAFGQTSGSRSQPEVRALPPFRHLVVKGLAVVYLIEGARPEASITVSGMPVEDIVTQVKEGVLTVTTTGEHSGEKIQIYLSVSDLQSITVGGAAVLKGNHRLTGEELSILIEGAGAATLAVEVARLKVRMKKAGDLTLSGKAGKLQLISAGSKGSLDNRKLEVVEWD